MGKKVLMLVTNEYRPDPRVHKEAKALIEGGCDVSVAAWDRERRRSHRETVEGVDLWRIYTRNARGNASLALNYPSFLIQSLSLAKRLRPDVVHAHDLDTMPIGILISWLRRIPLVFDAHERYAKMIAVDVPPFVSRLVQRLEDYLVPRADLVVTINDVMADLLRERAKSDVIVTMNCIELPPESVVKEHADKDAIVLLNPVTFEPMRYIEESMEVVSRLENCKLRIAGTGRLQNAVERAAKEHENIEYLGFLPFSKMMDEYPKADIVLLLADPKNENYRTGTANKMSEAMAFGLPLICSKGILSAKFIEEAKCGVIIEWSEEEFSRAVDMLRNPDLRNEMGRRGRKAAEKEHNWGIMKRRLVDAYAKLFAK